MAEPSANSSPETQTETSPKHFRRISADYVLTCDSSATDVSGVGLIEAGAIDIDDDGRIVAVGPETKLAGNPSHTERVGGLLTPGLVNAHAHTPMTLMRSAGDGLPLQRWLSEGVLPRESRMTPDDAYWGMKLGSAEMLLNGVTTSCEMYLFEESITRAVTESGARLMMTPAVYSALAPDGNIDRRLDQLIDFQRNFHNPTGRINVGMSAHSVYDLDPVVCGEIAAAAQQANTLFHIHLEETVAERELVAKRFGLSATKSLSEAGAFDGQTIAAHCVWLDDDDREILADHRTAVAHCPQSNLKLGSGIARLVELLKSNIIVGLGTDGPASNDSLDLWQEMKAAALLARGVDQAPGAIGASQALLLATRSSAEAIGIPEIGALTVGNWADLIRIDLEQPVFLGPNELVPNLVFGAGSRQVTDVWVAGSRVVTDGQLVTFDVGECIQEVRSRALRLAA